MDGRHVWICGPARALGCWPKLGARRHTFTLTLCAEPSKPSLQMSSASFDRWASDIARYLPTSAADMLICQPHPCMS